MHPTHFAIAVFLLSIPSWGQGPGAGLTATNVETIQESMDSPHYQADFSPVIANGSHAVAWDKGHLVSFPVGEVKEPLLLHDRSGRVLFDPWLEFSTPCQRSFH